VAQEKEKKNEEKTKEKKVGILLDASLFRFLRETSFGHSTINILEMFKRIHAYL